MLKEIWIKNFALIEKAQVEFSSQVNTVTGETGAGKSLFIETLELLTGGRGSREYIGNYGDKAVVEGVFTGDDLQKDLLTEYGIEADENLILKRELSSNGKSICRVNCQVVPLNVYRTIGRDLVDIHGQDNTQNLYQAKYQLQLLEDFGDEEYFQTKEEVASFYCSFREAEEKLTNFRKVCREAVAKKGEMNFQLTELDDVDLDADEDGLAKELILLRNGKKIEALLQELSGILKYDSNNILDKFYQARQSVEKLASIYDDFSRYSVKIENFYYELEDLAAEIVADDRSISYDPKALEDLEDKAYKLKKIKQKYQMDLPALKFYREELRQSLTELEESSETEKKLLLERDACLDDYRNKAVILSQKRKKLGVNLATKMNRELAELGMSQATFKVSWEQKEQGLDGWENIIFMLAPNLGSEFYPLAKIASGGEMARVMLALKVLSSRMGQSLMVFDEIDSGLGGRVVSKVGEKLCSLAQRNQLICITHSPLLASFSDHHIKIDKHEIDGKTLTRIEGVGADRKKHEIGRMISGNEDSQITMAQVEEMIEIAATLKGKVGKA